MKYDIVRVYDIDKEKKVSGCNELEVIKQVISAMDSGEDIIITKCSE